MEKTISFILFIVMISCNLQAQDTILERHVSLHFTETSIEEIMNYLSRYEGVHFSYSNDLVCLNKKIDLIVEDKPVYFVLNQLFARTEVEYKIYLGQIILFKKHKERTYNIKGSIHNQHSGEPVAYSTVEISGKNYGTVADFKGRFELIIKESQLQDTLRFSSLGFEAVLLPAGIFVALENHKVYLTYQTFLLKEVDVKPEDLELIVIGNSRNSSSGSLYMDTHGQQTALYIENRKQVSGRIRKVRYFLSSKGNSTAPFRVRIYEIDTASQLPGRDMLPEMLVVKPYIKKGWFEIDVSEYDLWLPENGFFVAMEGVFPNDYEFYMSDKDFQELSNKKRRRKKKDDISLVGLTYGQRLGYNRWRKNQTWHLSLSRKWFQIDKKNFNAMISAEIEIIKD